MPLPTTDLQLLTVRTPRGIDAQVFIRPDTNDAATLHSTMWTPDGQLHDEYGLREQHLSGWALDIGAHIGSVTFALALDNPDLHVIAVEAVPENVDALNATTAHLGMADRVYVVGEAAGPAGLASAEVLYGPYNPPGLHIPAEHAQQARYIGNLFRHHGPDGVGLVVPVVSLVALLERFGVEEVSFTKIDCEGCEWTFLASPAVTRLRYIVGEWHDRPASALRELLEPTHEMTVDKDDGGIGMFRAVLRP